MPPTAVTTPLSYSLKEGEGFRMGEAELVVLAIGDGHAEIEVGCSKALVHAGETISLGGGRLLVQQFSDDGRRRFVVLVAAPQEVAFGVISRSELRARATG